MFNWLKKIKRSIFVAHNDIHMSMPMLLFKVPMAALSGCARDHSKQQSLKYLHFHPSQEKFPNPLPLSGNASIYFDSYNTPNHISLQDFHMVWENAARIESSLSSTNLKLSVYSIESSSFFHKLDSNVFWTHKDALQMRPRSLDLHPHEDDGVRYV